MALSAAICMGLTNALQNYMQNSYYKFHANYTILVGVLGTNLFTLPCALPKLKIIKLFVHHLHRDLSKSNKTYGKYRKNFVHDLE